MSDQQQVFENHVDTAARAAEKAGLEIRAAATAASDLGDAMACGSLHMAADVLFDLVAQVEDEKEVVHVRLAESSPEQETEAA